MYRPHFISTLVKNGKNSVSLITSKPSFTTITRSKCKSSYSTTIKYHNQKLDTNNAISRGYTSIPRFNSLKTKGNGRPKTKSRKPKKTIAAGVLMLMSVAAFQLSKDLELEEPMAIDVNEQSGEKGRLENTLWSMRRIGVAIDVGIYVINRYYFYFPELLVNFTEKDLDEQLRRINQRKETHLKCAEKVREGMLKNGGVYIKFGQHISAMSYILPEEWTETMKPLQDSCEQSSIESLKKVIEAEMGRPASEIFSEIEVEPLGVASLAQVHRGRLRETGEEVAIKVQHQDVRKYAHVDIITVSALVRLIYKVFPEFQFMWLADEMKKSLPIEMNFVNEKNNAEQVENNFKNRTDIPLKIPRVISATPRVLIMEFIEGFRLDNIESLDRHNIKPARVSRQIARIFGEMTFNDGLVHCDPHPGNLLIRPSVPPKSWFWSFFGFPPRENFEIVLLDHGLYRRLSPDFRLDYARLWSSLLRGDKEQIDLLSRRFIPPSSNKADLHVVLSCILTGQSWDNVVSGNLSRTNISATKFDATTILSQSETFFFDISRVMAAVPPDLILLIKTNDLLRLIDRSLFVNLPPASQTRACTQSWLILSHYCLAYLYTSARSNILSFYQSHYNASSPLLRYIYSLPSLLFCYLNYLSLDIPVTLYSYLLS